MRTTAALVEATLSSVSYDRFVKPPAVGPGVSEARIRADLTAIAKEANAVRNYGSAEGLESMPAVATEFGLTVSLVIRIGKNEARNQREIGTTLGLVRIHPNVTRLVLGKKILFRHGRRL